MSDIAHALFSLGDWKAKAGKCERPDPPLGNLPMPKWDRGPTSIQRSGRKLPALRYQPYCLENPIRRHVYFPSGSSGAVFGSVTVVRAAFMIMAKNV